MNDWMSDSPSGTASTSTVLQMHPPQLPVLWRDAHLVVIHKPAGWLVHRTGLDAGETRFVVQTLRDQLGQHVYPVHRLDKGTCGLLVLALHREAARGLVQQFQAHTVRKQYLALVRGWLPAHAEADHALRPEDTHPDAPAQPAHTTFDCMGQLDWPESFDARHPGTRISLVLAQPTTGRRHQIRRHLKHLAHPIIGDATHGKGPLNRWWAERFGLQRLWLHALRLECTHPMTGEALRFTSDWEGTAASIAQGKPPDIDDLGHWQARLRMPGWQRVMPENTCPIALPW